MLLALLAVSAVLGSSRLRGFCSLGLGLAIGLIGIDKVSGQPRLTFGIAAAGRRHRHRRRRGRPSSPSARRCGSQRTCAARPPEIIPVGQPWMGRKDWKRSWKPWLRGTALGFPFGALPGRRRGDPDVPLLHHREAALQAPARSSARAPSRASPGRRRPTTPRPPGRWCRCCRWACRPTPPRRSCSPRSPAFGIQPGPLLFEQGAAAGVGPDRQPVHRQRAAAAAEPAAGAGLGRSCCRSRGPTCTPASCSSPASAPTR